jgi:hypothetical protein
VYTNTIVLNAKKQEMILRDAFREIFVDKRLDARESSIVKDLFV